MYLSEKQRFEALGACERIEVAAERMQIALDNIRKILDNVANGRDVNDGVRKLESVQ